jgi:hypothetical protein
MNRFTISMIALFGLAGLVIAQLPAAVPTPLPQQKKDEPKKDDPKKPDAIPVVPTPVTLPAVANRNIAPPTALAAAGTSFTRSSQPNVYGDFSGITGRFTPFLVATFPDGGTQTITPGQQVLVPVGTRFNRPVATQTIQVPITQPPANGAGPPLDFATFLRVTGLNPVAHDGGIPVNVVRGAFKIGENESPRPQDRIYATYNFFSDVNPTLNVPGLPKTNVHRETLGIEKTFFDGNASIGVRLPLIQINGPANIQGQGLGDLTAILKYAIVNDFIERGDGSIAGGNVLSVGVAVTAPTGNTVTYSYQTPSIHPTIIQPFIGAIFTRENYYVQGFTSMAIPTDSNDTAYFFNSLQLGYHLYQSPIDSGWLRSVTPIVEVHVNTPINNRGLTRLPIGATDQVSITSGATFGLGRAAFLNLGCNVPLTGPKPYAIETMAQLNIRF